MYIIFIILIILFLILLNLTLYEKFTQEETWLQKLSKKELSDFKKGQRIMTTMLKEFDRICRKYDLKYWCICGTLIGISRHKGWIPWDGDIDIAMLDTDYKKLQKIIQKELPKDMWFQNSTNDKNYNFTTGKIRYLHAYYCDDKSKKWHNGIQLDIFVYRKETNILKINNDMKCLDDIESNNIFPLKTGVFDGIEVYIPNKYKKYLIKTYGKYPPPMPLKKNQFCHEGKISFVIPDLIKSKYKYLYNK